MSKKFNLDGYIFAALSKIWRWWPPRREVINRATRVKDGCEENKCERCLEWFLVVHKFRRKIRQTQVDHIKPKIDPKKGFQGWDVLVKRTFVSANKLQNLCKSCHRRKTNAENKKRKR